MKRNIRTPLCAAMLAVLGLAASAVAMVEREGGSRPPTIEREFRGAWVATVDNIDWPSRRTLRTEQQQAELLAILDRCAALNFNAVVFQVRPACDALYASRLEPWSDYLTGTIGQPPSPLWDPLEFAVREAHRRGLELHAWFNPYRAHHPSSTSPLSPDHIGRSRPDLARTYGKLLWLDPGEPDVRAHTTSVVLDIVRRYDVDGVHLDDYFYPYKERDAAGNIIPFPDDPSWQRYLASGGTLARDDWRRSNVDTLIRDLYRSIKELKPGVKFGISPFGIWRPGRPAQIKGFDAYAELYADARKWLREGWLDYCAPQLYWKIDPPAQSYPVLLRWWAGENPRGRHLFVGNYAGRVGDGSWPAEELLNQIKLTREQSGADGNIHFSMKSLMRPGGIGDRLLAGPYAQPALPPSMPWIDRKNPPAVTLKVAPGAETVRWSVRSSVKGSDLPRWWLIQTRDRRGGWSSKLQPVEQASWPVRDVHVIAVTPIDAAGNAGRPAVRDLVD